MPADTAVDFENFARLVVPIMQQRGLFQKDYPAMTLRARLGLPWPSSPHAERRVAERPA